jgi:subtilisin family serine protease
LYRSTIDSGTHVAGTIAAKDNGFGVVGVAPGATVVAVKVVGDDGRGSFSTIIRGIQWIADNGKPGDVANISLSGNGNEALDKAIRMAARLGIQFTLSAGNHGGSAKERSPARANGRDIYTICASTETDDLAWFSNTGTPPIDFCAPGVGIKSTYKDGMYATMDGTSMAAPHAAGVLLLGKPKRRNKEVVDDEGNMYKIVALR